MTTNMMVLNVEKSIAFYAELFGFSVVNSVASDEGPLNFAILMKDNICLMLQQKDSFIAEYPILDTNKIQPTISLYIVVDNFDELYQTINGKTTLLADIHTTFYGSKEFAIADNDGYVLTISEKQG